MNGLALIFGMALYWVSVWNGPYLPTTMAWIAGLLMAYALR